jgi:ADP-ribose pyrophosphatase YjhB (NUDIX family)
VRRIAAYGLCLDDGGRVLLARTDDGRWALPGAVVGHGEDPRQTVVTAFATQAGAKVRVDAARDVVTEIEAGTGGAPLRQEEQLIFEAHADDPVAGDAARWASPQDLDTLPLTPLSAKLLGRVDDIPEKDQWTVPAPDVMVARQRFAAYALATDPKGNVLLARISDGYPSAGKWHLPGGGTNEGEAAVDGMLRELTEETGQTGKVESVLDVVNIYDRQAMGPEGRPIDFHGVSAIYRVRVDKPTKAKVIDPGGSTIEAGWFAPHEALALALTDAARVALLRALAAR